MVKLPVVTRLSTSIEQREYYESRARGAKLLIAYFVLMGIVVWSVLHR